MSLSLLLLELLSSLSSSSSSSASSPSRAPATLTCSRLAASARSSGWRALLRTAGLARQPAAPGVASHVSSRPACCPKTPQAPARRSAAPSSAARSRLAMAGASKSDWWCEGSETQGECQELRF